jgi:hypothetical protein
MVLRLAEIYFIRAEALAHLDDIEGAKADLNAVRLRAGVDATTVNDKTAVLATIEAERLRELFGEWGHRWLDLKRTGRADAVLGVVKPGWVPSAQLYPIPSAQLLNDPAMRSAQNPGYN